MFPATETQAAEGDANESRWENDPAHSSVEFSVRHMMVSTVKGQFVRFSGTILLDESDFQRSHVEAQIDADSVHTGVEDRDAHLRSADFFEVDKFPTISFRSKSIETRDSSKGTIHGDLTIHGVTRPVMLDVEFQGEITDPRGIRRRGFIATTVLDRKDFGITWNRVLDAGGVLAGDRVKVELNVEAVRKPSG